MYKEGAKKSTRTKFRYVGEIATAVIARPLSPTTMESKKLLRDDMMTVIKPMELHNSLVALAGA